VTKGDLVRVTLGGTENKRVHLCGVMDYRPDVLGGTSIQSWKSDGVWRSELISTPKRGEVLVIFYDDGDVSWIDESQVELVPG
jgi:hypothetical protein